MAAEQDRYGSKFGLSKKTLDDASAWANSWLGADGAAKVQHYASKKGIGAEQDRYGSHFGIDVVQKAKDALFPNGLTREDKEKYAGVFAGFKTGLGHDGLTWARRMALKDGVGAEQDRYGRSFGVDQSTIDKAKAEVRSVFK